MRTQLPARLTKPDDLEADMKDVVRIAFAQAQRASSTGQHDFLTAHVNDLKKAIDFDLIRTSDVRMRAMQQSGSRTP